MMRVVAIASRKGGVGKTALVVHLAAALAERGARVLVIDLDPQASASAWLDAEGGAGILEALTGNAAPAGLIRETSAPGVSILAASPALGVAEIDVAEPDVLRKRVVSSLAKSRSFEICLLDTPPGLGPLTINALFAADAVLVPVDPAPLALRGLRDMADAIEHAKGARLAGVVVIRATATRVARDAESAIRERFGPLVYRATVRRSVVVDDASGFNRPLTIHAPAAPVTEDFRAVAREFSRRA